MFFGDSTKDLVFRVLFEEWPLSAKEIYLRIKKISSKNVSYQAVHKILLSLVDSNILLKENGKYFFNKFWVENNIVFLNKLFENLDKGSKVFCFEEKVVFDTVYDVDKFLVKTCEKLNITKKDEIILQWVHFWIPLFIEKETYNNMKNYLLNSNFFAITPNSKPIDIWCANFWKKIGIKEKVGVNVGFDNSFFIFRDLIVQVFYPYEIKLALDEVYNSTKNMSELDINYFFKTVFEKKTRIPVLISRNKEVAMELTKMVKDFF